MRVGLPEEREFPELAHDLRMGVAEQPALHGQAFAEERRGRCTVALQPHGASQINQALGDIRMLIPEHVAPQFERLAIQCGGRGAIAAVQEQRRETV